MISVIIPSLGGNLDKVLVGLNSGTVIPNEIIICLPNKKHYIQNLSIYENVIVVYSNSYGQVVQRIFGFKKSKYDYILQLDDDVKVDKTCLEIMIKFMSNSKKNISVSPYWQDEVYNKPLHSKKKKGLIMLSYYLVINGFNGYIPGRISLSGTNFGVNFNEVDKSSDYIEVDWQPGGCILHKRQNLILSNYYPFLGKAYCEDLIHSLLLRKLGVSFVVVKKAKCLTMPQSRLLAPKELLADLKARSYFVRLAGLSIVRMYAYYILYILNSIIIRVVNER
jgi:glycosyltransferase involved in cell wall biosynthesis